jgi:hypothetical protein
MTSRDRIIQFLEYKGISKNKFYQKTGFANGFLDKTRTIGADKCEIICYQYSDLSLEWLLTGKGEMLKEDKPADSYSGYKFNGRHSLNTSQCLCRWLYRECSST